MPAPHLARPGDLLVVRVELLVQDQEPPDLGAAQDGVLREAPVHPGHLLGDELVDLGLLGEVGVARVCNVPALRPVPDGGEVDVDERRHVRAVLPDADGLLHEGRELQLVLEVLRREERPVGQTGHVLGAVGDHEVAVSVQEAGAPRAHPAVLDEGLAGRRIVLLIALEDAGAPVEDLALRRDAQLDAPDR